MHTTTTTIDRAKYPVGPFDWTAELTAASRADAIRDIEQLPARLRAALRALDPPLIDSPYREGGWTVRQLVHHMADSHLNGYARLKLALTEENPAVKAYDENLWAQLPDSQADVDVSLRILDGLHARWTALWRALTPEQFQRTFQHTQYGPMSVDRLAHLYGWHSRHHVAHVAGTR